MTSKGTQRASQRSIGRRWLLGLAVPSLMVALQLVASAPALAANVVNYTFHVPASVQTNPCFPTDVVNLSGDTHVVLTATHDHSGGYHVTTELNSQLSGASITTNTKYVNSQTDDTDWYARAPFPAVHTETHNLELISNNGTPNYLLHMTMHETVTAGGVPTAVVDNWSMGCKGRA